MNPPQPKNEGWLYGLAFLIAIGFRLVALGASPLTDSEATLALQAFHIAQGKATLLGAQPAYILFTSMFFAVIEATNFMARIVPALAGSALVFAPYFFREKIKPRPALVLAFLFAIDPGFVALSRQSGGTMLAVTSLLLAWAMWNNRRAIPAGIFAGLALLSGPSIWSGLLTIGLASLFLRGMESKPIANDDEQLIENRKSKIENNESQNTQITQYALRSTLIALFATVLLGGTLFFTIPNGLGAWLASLPAYLKGWVSSPGMTVGQMIFVLLAYEPLGIFLAVFALIRGFRTKSRRIVQLSVWLGVSFLLTIFYRQPDELVWVIIPLLMLGAMEFSRGLDIYREEYVEVGVVTTAVILLLTYIWFNVSNIALNPNGQISANVPLLGLVQNPRFLVLYGSLLIVIACLALVAFGWSARTARLGAIWSFAIFLGVYSLGASWGASGLRTPNGVELWNMDSKILQADLLNASVNDVSDFSRGHAQSQPVTIMGVSSPALEWLLRDHDVRVISVLDPQVAPPIVITPLMDKLNLPSAYRGQDFTWREKTLLDAAQTPDWLKWFVFRQLPMGNESVILWVRDDLFPDAHKNIQP